MGERINEWRAAHSFIRSEFVVPSSTANRLVEVDSTTYTWDNNGNLLSDGTSTYTYDSANRLTAVNGPQSAVSFAYNGLGDRLSQTVDGVPTTTPSILWPV